MNATYKQLNFIKELLEDLGRDPDDYNLLDLTRTEASEMIDRRRKTVLYRHIPSGGITAYADVDIWKGIIYDYKK